MSLAHDARAIGITGAVRSGCSTAAGHLREDRGFHHVRLSALVKDELRRTEPGAGASRQKLQAVGNRIRQANGRAELVRRAINKLTESHTRIVFDGIRNCGEVDELRAVLGYRFALLGVLSDTQTRWERAGDEYEKEGLGRSDFLEDDERDRSEGVDYGQQVAKCIDLSDAIVVNGDVTTRSAYRQKVIAMCDVLTMQRAREPTVDEIHMQMAFISSHRSRCLKRHVGAVIIDDEGEQTASGFNENPPPTQPCEVEYQNKCYRDIVRNKKFADLMEKEVRCPKCGQPLEVKIPGPPWRCSACATDLEQFFFPERAMSWCTAIHAEDRALRTAGRRARGATLYTTTFPCFQCAEKIIMAGVREVVFVEAYPDALSADRFAVANVTVRQFEGVLSPAFGRIFATARPE
ncbi:MAG: deaminase [Pseudonocardiaceae bacterium]